MWKTTPSIVLKSEISSRGNFSKLVAQGKGYLHFPLELTSEMDVKDIKPSHFPGTHWMTSEASSFPKEINGQNLLEEVIT